MADFRFYLSLLLRRIHYVVILVALGGAISVTLAFILPPTYVASARLVVESQQIPGNLAASTVQTQASEQIEIIRQRILSREALLEMANRLNIYAAQRREPGGALRPDEIVEDLRSRIVIWATAQSRRRNQSGQATFIDIRFSAESAELAAAVANEIVTSILQENVRIRTNVSGETLEFFKQEVDRLAEELSEIDARIIAFQEANREALPDSLDFRRAQLTNAQQRLIQLERDETLLRDRRNTLDALFTTTGQVPTSQSTLSAEAQQLQALKDQYTNELAVYSPQNPRMRLLQSRIDALETVVAAQQPIDVNAPGQGAAPLTPYDIQAADLDRQIAFSVEQREIIEAQIEALQASISATPANAIALQELQREQANLRAQYDRAVSARAQAETGDMIEALAKGERISVIEQATPPAEPDSPDRPKLIAAGVGGGLLAGLAIIALLELLNGSVRRPVEIVRALGITPIATLPYIQTRRERLRRRLLFGLLFLVVLAGIPAALWSVDTYIMPLDLLLDRILEKLPLDELRAVIEPAEEN